VGLPPEVRQRILQEERVRAEARERFEEEIRLRKRDAAFVVRLLSLLAVFAVSYFISNLYLNRSPATPAVAPIAPIVGPRVNEAALSEILQVLKPDQEAVVCAKAAGRDRHQIRATIEMARDLSRSQARRIAMDKAKVVGATLRRHGFAVPAYVEIFAPERWHGIAGYDSDSLQISWETCPADCEQAGTRNNKPCQQP
jgi:hypothetical protein